MSETADAQNLYPLWDPTVPFPAADEMEDLRIVTHILVERAQLGGYHYLHESAVAFHRDVLYVCWANHPTNEVNFTDEVIRGRHSTDGGFTWSEPEILAAAPQGGAQSFNHPVLHEHDGTLYGFFTRWVDKKPGVEIFALNDATGKWDSQSAYIPGFLPFRPPLKMRDGNWIIGGENYWYEAAVAISHGEDMTAWDVVQIPRPADLDLIFPETALQDLGDRVIAICRPKLTRTAPVAVSEDCGRTWTTLALSNFPLDTSQTYCGVLSTGQYYLMTCNHEDGRALLQIAVTRPGEERFSRIWKLRHQKYPKRRLFGGWGHGNMVGQPTEWSYPAAVERDGKLYVTYTQGKEDCCLSIIPISVLAAE
jgi:hypothetical protein